MSITKLFQIAIVVFLQETKTQKGQYFQENSFNTVHLLKDLHFHLQTLAEPFVIQIQEVFPGVKVPYLALFLMGWVNYLFKLSN